MTGREGIFSGNDPFAIIHQWMSAAEQVEPNDPGAIALATVDAQGLPDVRMVLLRGVEGGAGDGSLVFYTNYHSAKARQMDESGLAAFVMHWKTLRRQIRVRGRVTREDGATADAYYHARALESRIGAWASDQSQPLASREALMQRVEAERARLGPNPDRPPFWGGYRIHPTQIEFWADGAARLHDRFVWQRLDSGDSAPTDAELIVAPGCRWAVQRLNP